MKLAVRDAEGKEVRQISVDDSVFGIQPNGAVLHQAFVAQRANQRRGTASTKTRSEVQGSTAKLRRQKYIGRARVGSNRAPTRVGGGVTFGPRPRSYAQALPKKMRRLAIRSALSGKVADGQLHVIDKLGFETPRTKEVVRILDNVGIERSALIVTGEPDRSTLASARNRPKTKVLPAAYLNVVDLLTHRDLLLTEDAVRVVEGLWGGKAAQTGARPGAPAAIEEAKPRRRRAATATESPAVEAETPPAAEAPPAEKPARSRRTPAKAEAAPEEAPKPARRARKPKAEAAAGPAAEASAEDKPKRAPRARKPKAEEA
jgi:large subunit ribosomal protein L4